MERTRYEGDIVAEDFLKTVFIPYLDIQENLDEVPANELAALISGYQVCTGKHVPKIHLKIAAEEMLQKAEARVLSLRGKEPSMKLLMHCSRLAAEYLMGYYPTVSPPTIPRRLRPSEGFQAPVQ